MKIHLVFLLLLIGLFSAEAQEAKSYTETDSIALAIPESLTYATSDIASYINAHFDNEPDKLRAIFTWLASNIHYNFSDQRSYLAADELDNYISETLRRRKGRCSAYAETFHRICQECGIVSQVVSGIVIPENGLPPASHAWIAARTENTWKLYDPTYAAGYVMEERYYKKLDYEYFAVSSDVLIRSHYPFDPLWQMLSYPISLNTFFNPGDTLNNPDKEFFDYADSIQNYLLLGEKEQMLASRRRIIGYGAPNKILEEQVASLDQQIYIEEYNQNTELFNQCVNNYNAAVEQFNSIMKNSSPSKLNHNKKQGLKEDIRQLRDQLKSIKSDLLNIETEDKKFTKSMSDLKLAADKMLQDIGRYEKQLG